MGDALGPVVEDYLKAIYKLAAAGEPCTLSRLSTSTRTSRTAVAKMANRLEELKLVTVARSHESKLALTPAGEKIARLLGYPTRDPHGDPIPTRDGRVENPQHVSLGELEPGQTATIRRVSDADSERLRYLSSLGLVLDTPVELLAREPFGGLLRLRVAGVERTIGTDLARSVFVATHGGSA